MGLFDKMKSTAQDLTAKTQNAIESKKEEKEEAKRLAEIEKEENAKLASIFNPTTELGDISIDTNNRLFKVKHASGDIKKNSGTLMKTGKAIAAFSTLGASIAIEAAMKPDDKIFRFDVLDSYELIEDDAIVSSGGVGAAVAGGVLFGGVGAVVGGMTGKKKQKKSVENLVLQINTKDITFPCIMVTYIKKETKVSSNAYKEALSLAKQSMQCLNLIIDDENATNAETSADPSPSSVDPVEEIKKYKELLDIGVITDEEFELKKKELLGL